MFAIAVYSVRGDGTRHQPTLVSSDKWHDMGILGQPDILGEFLLF